MKIETTSLPGVLLVVPRVFHDDRGFFLETYHRDKFDAGGVDVTFVQDNHSRSQHGTLRGLHAQTRKPQGKLVRCIEGEIYDVAADVRRGSPTFGKWVGVVLSAQNFRQLYVPPGFVHGFYTVSEFAQVEYKCTDVYDPGHELSILWNDPDLAVDWPLSGESPVLSPKDAAGLRLADATDQLPLFQES
jgi:dTDP-4-dehydrorhamnose 3,5-epimerase